MNLRSQFKRFGLTKVHLGPEWANVEIEFKDDDQAAAWECTSRC